MSLRYPSQNGWIAPTLSLLALTGLACWLPLRLAAQTPPPVTPEQDKQDKTVKSDTNTDKKTEIKPDVKPTPPAPNPVIITGQPVPPNLVPDSKMTAKEPVNRTDRSPANAADIKKLPLFGYDFFKPQREMIEARRAYLKKLQEEQLRGPRTGNANSRNTNTGTGTNNSSNNAGTPGPNGTTTPGGRSGAAGAGIPPRPGTRSGVNTNDGTDNFDQSDDTDIQDDTGNNGTGRAGTSSRTGSQTGANNPQNNATQMLADPLLQMFQPVNGSPPLNYTLGPGDYLQIQYSSPTLETVTVNRYVDANGAVSLKGLAPINVTGKTLDGAEKALTTQLLRMYNNVQVTVSLNRLRSIQVTVSGSAYLPGSYSVPSVASAFSLLLAAGGPTEDGSLRAIEVRRRGRVISTIDMYKLLKGSGDVADVPLQSGDMIVIPPRQSRVAVSGEVRTPAIFELMPEETLKDALHYAGGVKPSGVDQRVQINTLEPGAVRVLRDVDLKQPNADKTAVYDGDAVEVFSLRARLTNTVTIEGAVDQPSDYALTPGMKVSDLVNRARGLLSEAYPIADLHRWQPDNTDSMLRIDLEKVEAHDPTQDIVLTKWDRIKVYTRDEVAWTGHRIVTVSGSVKKYGTYTHSKNMRISDLLRMAGGPLPDAYLDRAVLMHQHDDAPPSLEYVNLNAVIRGDPSKDVLVQDNDNLSVYSVGQAQFTPDHIVRVDGEVVAPGSYPRAENMRVSDLLILSGGFRPNAGSTIVVTHARRIADTPGSTPVAGPKLSSVTINFDSHGRCAPIDDIHLEDGDVVTIQGQGGFINEVQTIHVFGSVNKPGPIPLTSKKMRLSDALREAGGLRPEAFPQGAEFYRNPKMLETDSQRTLATSLGSLNDLLTDSEYRRARAQAQLQYITATGQAAQDASGVLGGLSGLGGSSVLGGLSGLGGAAAAPSANLSPGLQGNPQDLVSSPRKMGPEQIDPNGNIAINLPGALRKPMDVDDIVLQPGDTITIPETPTTVQLVGAVFHPRGVLFKSGETLQQYVDEAGGFAPDAAKDRIEVIRVGGGLIAGKKVRQIMPGDVILVPNKVLAASIGRHSNGINDFFKSLTNSALIFKFATSLFGL